jgi:hypothetical protein
MPGAPPPCGMRAARPGGERPGQVDEVDVLDGFTVLGHVFDKDRARARAGVRVATGAGEVPVGDDLARDVSLVEDPDDGPLVTAVRNGRKHFAPPLCTTVHGGIQPGLVAADEDHGAKAAEQNDG